MNTAQKTQPTKLSELLQNNYLDRLLDKPTNVSTEHQSYGLRLADMLGDIKHKTLYIKIAKDVPRGFIEKAASFALDYPTTTKGRVFMWKLTGICKEKNYRFSLTKRKKQSKIDLQLNLFA